ncbi:MAG: hypothetical protein PHF72_06560 [Gammaproteobacteria bacterium]|nr:hypothetical protein [Gammaproteobacteria bacterium]
MTQIHIARVALILQLTVPAAVYAQHLAASPEVVGGELARQVDAYARANRLGYYPALDFFRRQGGIDPELIQAADDIAWFSGQYARSEITRRLRGVFSTVAMESVTPQAFSMPAVRPGRPNALVDLARHYTPDTLRVELRLSMIHRDPEAGGMDRLAVRQALRMLGTGVGTVEVINARLV